MKVWEIWGIIVNLRGIGVLLEYGPHLTTSTGLQYAIRLSQCVERALQQAIDDVS